MGNSGVGMLLGDTSATLLWVWFIGAFVLGGAILYGVPSCAAASERSWIATPKLRKRRDDPQKRYP